MNPTKADVAKSLWLLAERGATFVVPRKWIVDDPELLAEWYRLTDSPFKKGEEE